ncbi:MAG: hypothetical protein BJ554DRAFT_3459 [Olpidium bornovanus]|uniref:Uncharacterized protein n=1 Tax=Olpidium bornovanus TaxID=278681 RepID=A0A8H8A0B8_9FUNG|nr:MAG: hypothetical protein BJ554DRAFT_3459 [Olpidium bornovanus]
MTRYREADLWQERNSSAPLEAKTAVVEQGSVRGAPETAVVPEAGKPQSPDTLRAGSQVRLGGRRASGALSQRQVINDDSDDDGRRVVAGANPAAGQYGCGSSFLTGGSDRRGPGQADDALHSPAQICEESRRRGCRRFRSGRPEIRRGGRAAKFWSGGCGHRVDRFRVVVHHHCRTLRRDQRASGLCREVQTTGHRSGTGAEALHPGLHTSCWRHRRIHQGFQSFALNDVRGSRAIDCWVDFLTT